MTYFIYQNSQLLFFTNELCDKSEKIFVCAGILTCQFFKKKDITEYIISEKIDLPKLAIQLQCAANMFHGCSTIIQGVSGVSLIF